MTIIIYFIACVLAYLIGSVSSAIVISKLLNLPDPRLEGSKNPGATNVLRLGGKKAGILTLFGDILKGVLPVLAAKLYGFNSVGLSLVAFSVFIGHLYPVFFQFKGGKGVATAFGFLAVLNGMIAASLAAVWLIVAILFRYSSLASLVCAVCAPFITWYFTDWNYTVLMIATSALLIFRHRKNIRNLIAGKEGKLFQH